MLGGILEVIDPAVFKEPAQETSDRNVIAQALYSRFQTANATHDKVDPYACLRGRIEGVHAFGVDQAVDLDDDPGFLA